MTIEYKIKFENDTVTITQSVSEDASQAADGVGGGAPKGGAVGGGPHNPIAVILGPLVIGGSGPQGAAIPRVLASHGLDEIKP